MSAEAWVESIIADADDGAREPGSPTVEELAELNAEAQAFDVNRIVRGQAKYYGLGSQFVTPVYPTEPSRSPRRITPPRVTPTTPLPFTMRPAPSPAPAPARVDDDELRFIDVDNGRAFGLCTYCSIPGFGAVHLVIDGVPNRAAYPVLRLRCVRCTTTFYYYIPARRYFVLAGCEVRDAIAMLSLWQERLDRGRR